MFYNTLRVKHFVGNKAKGRISERVLQENKAWIWSPLLKKTLFFCTVIFNSFETNVPLSYSMNTSEKFWFSDVLRRYRSSRPEVFLEKGVLKICSKFTGEYPYQNTISIKLQSNFIEITLLHGCSSVNMLHIFRTAFLRDVSGWLLLEV